MQLASTKRYTKGLQWASRLVPSHLDIWEIGEDRGGVDAPKRLVVFVDLAQGVVRGELPWREGKHNAQSIR